MSNHISSISLRIKPPYGLRVNKDKKMLTFHSAGEPHVSPVHLHGTEEALAGFACEILKVLGHNIFGLLVEEKPPDELVFDEPPVCDMCGGQGWFVPEGHLGGNPYQHECPQCAGEGVMPDVGSE